MRDLNVLGQIILLIVFVLVPLIKFVVQQVKKRLEGQIPEEASVTQIDQQAQAPPETLPTPRRFSNPVPEAKAPIVSTPQDRSRYGQRTLIETRHDARRGIILMTILGPCRALDPPDS